MHRDRPQAIVVGAGAISRAWFEALSAQSVGVAAVVDLDRQAAEAAVERFGLVGARVGQDLGKILAEVRADFLVDLTVPQAHCQVTCQALEAGLPVLGEKPMAPTLEQARRMVATAERTGRLFMVSQSRRYEPAHRQVAAALRDGCIGRLNTLQCDFFRGPHFGGFREQMEHVLLVDMAIHHFDLARMFSGADPVRVLACEYNPVDSWYAHGAAAHCLFEMTGGLRFAYNGSWAAEGSRSGWNGDWRIIGAEGTILLVGDGRPSGQRIAGNEGFERPVEPVAFEAPPDGPTAMQGALCEFLDALATGSRPQGECHDNIRSLAMVLAAVESAQSGRAVEVRW